MEGFHGFAAHYGQTLLHPLALAAVIISAFLVLALPRRFALAPLIVAATTLPMAQRVVIAGADFTMIRLLLLAYLMRFLLRGEWRAFTWNRLDTAVILWAVAGTTIMTLHHGTVDVLVTRLGWSYDIILGYFAGRVLLRGWGDMLGVAKVVAFISVPVAVIFLYEWTTQYNLFHVFGGVPEITNVREGRVRCRGPFAHAIIAGTFWAAMLPLIWLLWSGDQRSRVWALVGTVSAFTIIAATASSTPLLSAMAALGGAGLFLLRHRRTQMWVGVIAMLFVLHFFVMQAPVWHLISRVDIVGGSSGWWRYVILDTFINHFSEWYLTGYATPTDWRWQMRDITNEFIIQGLSGGLVTLTIFIFVLVFAFGNVGQRLAELEGQSFGAGVAQEWRLWLVGVMVFVHLVTFTGLSYFGQMNILWYLQLAMAGAVGAGLAASQTVIDPQTAGRRQPSPFGGQSPHRPDSPGLAGYRASRSGALGKRL